MILLYKVPSPISLRGIHLEIQLGFQLLGDSPPPTFLSFFENMLLFLFNLFLLKFNWHTISYCFKYVLNLDSAASDSSQFIWKKKKTKLIVPQTRLISTSFPFFSPTLNEFSLSNQNFSTFAQKLRYTCQRPLYLLLIRVQWKKLKPKQINTAPIQKH